MKLIKDLGMKYPTEESTRKARYGIYECPACLIHFETQTYAVNAGTSQGCRPCSRTTHGMSRTRLYKIYNHMHDRCNKPHLYPDYSHISVDKEWLEFEPFMKWSLENGYDENLSIDRIDNSGNYNSNNCRWTTHEVQVRNTRQVRKTNKSGYRGVSWSKAKNRWIGQICVNNKRTYLGSSDSKKEVAEMYNKYVQDNNLEHTQNTIGKIEL